MKKSLVLALALAMGVSATALAANPFSDVPAGHWAYGSIAKLAAAGVVDGYGDGTYRGDRLMTRYEMAQIVARAMAKGANVDRLASEFADELDSLGVRVAKLEKKSDNVKITGEVRYSYANTEKKNKYADYDNYGSTDKAYDHALRSRIWLTGAVNDNWNYVGMLENNHSFSNDMSVGGQKSLAAESGEGTAFQRAYLEGRLGGTKVTAGRFNHTLADGNLYDNRFDGVKVQYGKKVRLGAYYGRPTNQDGWNDEIGYYNQNDAYIYQYDKAWGVNAAGEVGKLALTAGYDRFTNGLYYDSYDGKSYDDEKLDNLGVWNVGANYNFGKASLGVVYLHSNWNYDGFSGYNYSTEFADASKSGVVVTGTYGNAEAAKPGSYGLVGKYYNQGPGTFVAHTMNGAYQDFAWEGFKGFSLARYYTVAKNMVAGVEYYDLKGRETDNTSKTWWGQMVVTF